MEADTGFWGFGEKGGIGRFWFVWGKYTWCNIREGARCTWVKLDRGFGNLAQKTRFLKATVHIFHSSHSDHKPLCLSFDTPFQWWRRLNH